VDALPAPTTRGEVRCSKIIQVPSGLFDEHALNLKLSRGFSPASPRAKNGAHKKSGCGAAGFFRFE
jgi:hypothetical protein